MLELARIKEEGIKLYGTGNQVIHLDSDMMTILDAPKMLIPGWENSGGTGFEGHEFFEASSMRKVDNQFFFIYSSILSHELCYAVSDYPDHGFRFGGTIISNADIGYQGRPTEDALNDWGNNHGSIEKINGQWYVFYHRQTNKNEQSRQGCAEPIEIVDGKICQVEMTSQGLSGAPLPGKGTYPAYIACNLYAKGGALKCGYGTAGKSSYPSHPCITQEPYFGLDRQMICNMRNGSTAGFKYFSFENLHSITLTVRGSGKLLISLTPAGALIAALELPGGKDWQAVTAATQCVTGVHPLYIRCQGRGHADILDFTLE